jgi:hypothetical protein
MSLTVADLDTLEQYLAGVMNRSGHHAETVGAVALALLGAVLWRRTQIPRLRFAPTTAHVRMYSGCILGDAAVRSRTTTTTSASTFAIGLRVDQPSTDLPCPLLPPESGNQQGSNIAPQVVLITRESRGRAPRNPHGPV